MHRVGHRGWIGVVGVLVAACIPGCKHQTSAAPSVSPSPAPSPVDRSVFAIDDFPSALSFVDNERGLLLKRHCAANDCVLRSWLTSDGGSTWSRGGPLPIPRSTDARLVMTSAVDAYATGAKASQDSVTHDGGRTWHAIDLPGRSMVPTPLGAELWVFHNACKPTRTTASCAPLLYGLSRDGTIDLLSQPPTHGRPILSIVRASSQIAVMVAGVAQASDALVLTTTNAGGTWVQKTNPCGSLSVSVEIGAAGGIAWALCAGQPGTGSQLKRLFTSADGAATWTRRPDPELGGYSTHLVATSATTAWRWGDGRADVLRTQDAGRTWRSTLLGRIGEAAGGGAYRFAASDDNHAWVIPFRDVDPTTLKDLPPVILHTTDGGRRWTTTPRPGSDPV